MPKKNTHTDSSVRKVPTKLYDMIMGAIEPDLVSDRLSLLDIFYKGESPEAHEARMARYERAYAQCEKVIAKLEMILQEEVRNARKQSGLKAAHAESEEKQRDVESMELLIDSPGDDA